MVFILFIVMKACKLTKTPKGWHYCSTHVEH